MSTSKTQHYHLHAWTAGDDFLRTEINENFAALDEALKSEADARTAAIKAEADARAAAIKAEADARVAAMQGEAVARASAINAAKSALESKISAVNTALNDRAKLVVGYYIGDTTVNREFALGGPVLAVLLENDHGYRQTEGSGYTWGGAAIPGVPLPDSSLRVSGNSFFVSTGGTSTWNHTNYSGAVYIFFAWIAQP